MSTAGIAAFDFSEIPVLEPACLRLRRIVFWLFSLLEPEYRGLVRAGRLA